MSAESSSSSAGGTQDTPQIMDPPHRSESEIFEQLKQYPFATDREFATGLAIILGHPEIPASEEEIARNDDLVLQAKCYYFAREQKLASPINVAAYKSWLYSESSRNPPIDQIPGSESQGLGVSTPSLSSSSSGHTRQITTNTQEEPTYPTSFAHIVELITTGQPVPGIQQIPDTVLAGQDAPSSKERRRKPWEMGEAGVTP